MTSGTVSSLFVLLVSCSAVLAQQQAQFNQVLNLNGDMALNSFIFPDRSKIETFSQKQQQIIVNQQTPAIPPNQVTGTSGQPFVAITTQSMVISSNSATDLVGGQVEMALSTQILQQNAVSPDNTYVAMLSPDRQSWMIQESLRSVNATDMTVRMVKRTQLDGEYMILGRQTVETNTLVTPFGDDGSTSVAIQGSGLQENEFQDGFRMAVRATQPTIMNVNVKNGVDQGMLSALQGQQPVNNYRYSVTTNLAGVTANLNQQVTVIQMPINAVRIQKMMQDMGIPANGQVALGVAQRSVLQNPGGATQLTKRDDFRRGIAARQIQNGQQIGQNQINQGQQNGSPTIGNIPAAAQLLLAPTFTAIQAEAVIDQANMRIAIPVRQVDGEFILTMQRMGGGAPAPAAPAEAAAPAAPAAPAEAAPAPPAARNGTEPAARERRAEEPKTDKYGLPIAPKGYVMMTMKMADDMAASVNWGGQAPITKMMDEYVKAQTGRAPEPLNNGTQKATGKAPEKPAEKPAEKSSEKPAANPAANPIGNLISFVI